MIEANNKMFMITLGMFILIVVAGFLATMFFAPAADTELTSLSFKAGKTKVKLQLMKVEKDLQYYYNVQKGITLLFWFDHVTTFQPCFRWKNHPESHNRCQSRR
jgi:hypothetical protein